VRALVRYGGDVYHDRVRSDAWIEFTDVALVVAQSRGQYLTGSRYTWGGAFVEGQATVQERLTARAGGRLSAISAHAPADPESGTSAVDQRFVPLVGSAGVEWAPTPETALLANLDLSFRAPNLDDLTSRQQTGPGFQFENPRLGPERAITGELGARARLRWLDTEAWLFHSTMLDAIARAPRPAADCPPATPQCQASWSRLQLVNLGSTATLLGAEAAALLRLPAGLRLRATIAYALGEGPDPQGGAGEVPLSRVPPLNGTAELRWRSERLGLHSSAGLRWAGAQTRLAPGDLDDARIPTGGTPAFAALDLRVGYRHGDSLQVNLVVENLGDAAYRYHGSSTNGAGRGLILSMQGGL
jgi:iron complex outermembrane receptor protein/hemoglobin/transferrin/lactoferrin receptor protein